MKSIVDRAKEFHKANTPTGQLAHALLEAVECLEFYADLECPNGNHACNVDVRFQIDGGDKARAFLDRVLK